MYVCLVVVQHCKNGPKYMFQAPAWANIKAGDQVTVETAKVPATVVSAMTCNTDSREYKFAMETTGAYLPLKKVLNKLVYEPFYYEDEKSEIGGDGPENSKG